LTSWQALSFSSTLLDGLSSFYFFITSTAENDNIFIYLEFSYRCGLNVTFSQHSTVSSVACMPAEYDSNKISPNTPKLYIIKQLSKCTILVRRGWLVLSYILFKQIVIYWVHLSLVVNLTVVSETPAQIFIYLLDPDIGLSTQNYWCWVTNFLKLLPFIWLCIIVLTSNISVESFVCQSDAIYKYKTGKW
jgi:hypothetical protein